MIAAWMMYCSLCALGLGLAGSAAERALLGGRAPVRFVWLGAVVLSLLIPAVALRSPAPVAAPVVIAPPSVMPVDAPSTEAVPAIVSTAQRQAAAKPFHWRATLTRLDGPLTLVWIALSLAVVFNVLGGVVALAWMRKSWRREEVLGVPVFVSPHTGPAVVGTMSPSIVLPEWVLSLDASQLSLMLRHEQEHQRAGDGRLLTAMHLALVAMPWNPALWWQLLRLRVAVELDCDARVLRDADARSYGDLLLEVARPRRVTRLIGATAFAERATQLERRIRVLARHRVRTSRAARALVASVTLVALTAAWAAPHPRVPARATTVKARTTPTRPAPATTGRKYAQAAEIPSPIVSATPKSTGERRANVQSSRSPAVLSLPVADARPVVVMPGPEDSVFALLFRDIKLTGDNEAKARALLARLLQDQTNQDQAAAAAMLATRARNVALQGQRDSALRAMLTNDADRAAFDAHLVQTAGGGGRGRIGGPPDSTVKTLAGLGGRGGIADTGAVRRIVTSTVIPPIATWNTPPGGVGGRGGGGGGGGGGGRGASTAGRPDSATLAGIVVKMDKTVADLTYNRLFAGITLTPDQEAAARQMIEGTQAQTRRPLGSFMPTLHLRLNPISGVVAMQQSSAQALLALVSNDADRGKLQARIMSIP